MDIYKDIIGWTKRLLNPKSGISRKGVLIFTRFIRGAEELASEIPSCAIVSGPTPKEERARIPKGFKDRGVEVVANVGVLTTGFGYPELDTIVPARPAKPLSLYYQMVGHVIRPCQGKEGQVVDLSGNFRRFGRVEELRIEQPEKEK